MIVGIELQYFCEWQLAKKQEITYTEPLTLFLLYDSRRLSTTGSELSPFRRVTRRRHRLQEDCFPAKTKRTSTHTYMKIFLHIRLASSFDVIFRA